VFYGAHQAFRGDVHAPDLVCGRASAAERGVDEHLSIWLRGTHDVLGFVYLVLGVPA
jgi:hypothetical protein